MPEFPHKGTLRERPLPVLLAQILEARLSGMLRIESEGLHCWIYFDEGFPACVHNPRSQDFLGSVLRELGFIDDNTYNSSLAIMAKTRNLHGQILLSMEAIDQQKLDRGLSLQLARKISRLFALRAGQFRFTEDEGLPPPHVIIRINSYALIYNAIRNTYNLEELDRGLQPIWKQAVRVSRRFVERGALFEFPPEDLEDARILEEYRLPEDFTGNARSGPTAAKMLLFALHTCGMLEIDMPSLAQPINGLAAPPLAEAVKEAAPPSEAPPLDAFAQKISDKFEQVRTGHPWEILEVPPNADQERLKKAFLTLVKTYHPDRLANSGDEALRHRLDIIVSRINDAHRLMMDPEARRQYEQNRGTEGGAGPTKGRPEEARNHFQKAMVFFKKKEFDRAAELLRWAVEGDPNNGDYQAWRIWIDLQRRGPAEALTSVKTDLSAVWKAFPKSFWAARFLSQVLFQIGELENYERILEAALKLNPNDIECTRELRLLKMRQKKGERGFLGIRKKKS